MDTSMKWYEDPIYIKMCDCEEIQEQRPTGVEFVLGDYATHRNQRGRLLDTGLLLPEIEVLSYECDTSYGDMEIKGKRDIWLPTQSQLQILSGLGWFLFDKTCVTWATVNPDYQRESKEIIGLRVVMHTTNKKKWNGEEWIK